jgi:3-oxoacyl-[acyl-carrier protein] reductase
MSLNIDLTGRTALITGATQGIGKAIACQFEVGGAILILTGTNQSQIDELNAKMQEEGRQNTTYLQLDLSSDLSVDRFLKDMDGLTPVDICVNNAGVNRVSSFSETSEEDFDWMHRVNLRGPYRILKHLLPHMQSQQYGRVVNIASIWSIVTRKRRSLYTTTKNALVGMTEALAVELASDNVLVNAVSPGFTLTELTRRTNTATELSSIEGTIPMGRLAQPEEIANTVAFLCSDLNSYITGQNIAIDGGYTNL